MPFDLSDVIENIKAAVNPPGSDLFPDANDDMWLVYGINAFWDVRLDGMLAAFTIDDDGLITPNSGTTDISREQVQIIVFYAAVAAVFNRLANLRTQFRAKAGPVEYETQQSATLLRDVLNNLKLRRSLLLARLSDIGSSETVYIDSLFERSYNLAAGIDSWISAGSDANARGGVG